LIKSMVEKTKAQPAGGLTGACKLELPSGAFEPGSPRAVGGTDKDIE